MARQAPGKRILQRTHGSVRVMITQTVLLHGECSHLLTDRPGGGGGCSPPMSPPTAAAPARLRQCSMVSSSTTGVRMILWSCKPGFSTCRGARL